MLTTPLSRLTRRAWSLFVLALILAAGAAPVLAQGEAELKLPDLGQAIFLNGITGPTLLLIGLGVSLLGFVFGLAMYSHLRNLPFPNSMLELSDLLYSTS